MWMQEVMPKTLQNDNPQGQDAKAGMKTLRNALYTPIAAWSKSL